MTCPLKKHASLFPVFLMFWAVRVMADDITDIILIKGHCVKVCILTIPAGFIAAKWDDRESGCTGRFYFSLFAL